MTASKKNSLILKIFQVSQNWKDFGTAYCRLPESLRSARRYQIMAPLVKMLLNVIIYLQCSVLSIFRAEA